jgi:hypothetical protein
MKTLSIIAAKAALVLALGASTSIAAEVSGVKVADTVKLGDAELVLNGAGLRSRAMFKVYVAALYLPGKRATEGEVFATKGPKRMALHLMRDLTAEQLTEALNGGLNDNLSEAEKEKFKAQIADLTTTMTDVGAAKEKQVVTLDWMPGQGTRVALNGTAKGKTIAGEDFYNALLRIWIGAKPIGGELKAALLGKSQ